MIEIESKKLIFKIKDIYFSDYPCDVSTCDYVMFHDCRENFPNSDFKIFNTITSIIDLSKNIDIIWQNIDRKSTRHSISRAQKKDIKIKINQDIDEFYELFSQFIQQKSISAPFNIGLVDINAIKKNGIVFTAYDKEELLAGNVYLNGNNTFRLWISASKRLNSNKEKTILIGDANRLIHWTAIQYAKENKFLEFDWGGLWPDEIANQSSQKKNINSFKLHFGGKIENRYSYEKIYSKSYRVIKQVYEKILG